MLFCFEVDFVEIEKYGFEKSCLRIWCLHVNSIPIFKIPQALQETTLDKSPIHLICRILIYTHQNTNLLLFCESTSAQSIFYVT